MPAVSISACGAFGALRRRSPTQCFGTRAFWRVVYPRRGRVLGEERGYSHTGRRKRVQRWAVLIHTPSLPRPSLGRELQSASQRAHSVPSGGPGRRGGLVPF